MYVFSKLTAMTRGTGEFNYTMEEFEELRHNPDAFEEFLEDYVSVVVGKNDFKTNSKYKKLSSFVTVSDEAFALLTIKNNEEVWPVKVNNSMLGNSEEHQEEPKTRYTNRRRLIGSPRDGWTKEGMKKFKEYYKLVVNNRRSEKGIEFEKNYLEKCRKGRSGRKRLDMNTRDSSSSDGEGNDEDVTIPNDWDDDVNCVAEALIEMGGDERIGNTNMSEFEM